MIGYIARDKDGKLYLYSEKPEYDDENELWFGGDYLSMSDGLLLCKELIFELILD